jgi:hypothetical protein
VNSIRLLLNSVIDYAGLFPPAGLGMAESLRNYANYKTSDFSWTLGRFIVPVSRLSELKSCIGNPRGQNWRLSALAGDNPQSDLEIIEEFNHNCSPLTVDAVEVKTSDIRAIDRALKIFGGRFETYLEFPADKNNDALIAAIAEGGGRAKVRAGGTRPEMFPSTVDLAKFILSCAEHLVPFKATAGLHHTLRSIHPLTYKPSSPSGKMHGFLNMLAASAFAYDGADAELLKAILEEETIQSFDLENEGLSWRGRRVGSARLREMRERFFHSFGSCSFEEPISEMKALRML